MNWLLFYILAGLGYAAWSVYDHYYFFKEEPERISKELKRIAPFIEESLAKKLILIGCIGAGIFWPIAIIMEIYVHKNRKKDR